MLMKSFNSLQTGKRIQRSMASKNLSMFLCFNSLQTGKRIQRAPILSPVGPWLQNAKTKREVHKPFFMSNFSQKIPQTHVYIDPNAIFYQKWL